MWKPEVAFKYNFTFLLNLIPDSSVDFHIQHSQSSDGENAGEDQAGPVDVKSE